MKKKIKNGKQERIVEPSNKLDNTKDVKCKTQISLSIFNNVSICNKQASDWLHNTQTENTGSFCLICGERIDGDTIIIKTFPIHDVES